MKIRGKININQGQENNQDPPDIIFFRYQEAFDDLNKFYLTFSAKNYVTLFLIKTIVDTGQKTSIDVTGKDTYFDYRHSSSDTTFELQASKGDVVVVETITIRSEISQTNPTLSPLTASTTITRVINTTNQIDVIIKINKTINFDPEDVKNIILHYQEQGSLAWELFSINTKYIGANRQMGGGIIGYSFGLQNGIIKRGAVGGFFDFYVFIKADGFEDYRSEMQTLFFENIQIETFSEGGSQALLKAEILDAEHPALLRYEVTTKFSEMFEIKARWKKRWANESELTGDSKEEYYENNYDQSHHFLDAEEVVGLGINSTFNYPYVVSNEETRGYMYPACVSEILPCILTQRLDSSSVSHNRLIILFWKINDNFFDYNYFHDQINIKTILLIVKVQYKNSSGAYQDLTDQITLTQEKHFNTQDQKFILSISRKDSLNDVLFNKVNENDNYSDNLRILILQHAVNCSFTNILANDGMANTKNANLNTVFDKLLIPHEWKYICYDKFLNRNAEAKISENNLSLSLNSPYLRGVRLPEKGFACFDKLTDVNIRHDSSELVEEKFDVNIFYKLKTSVEAFYFDPIYKGTVSSIKLPVIPDDVFLIPPELEISPPNLIKSGFGSEQAEGVVRLNEYGKISSIELTNLGQGYSLYKTLQDQREQSEFDIIPNVSIDYTIVSNNLNVNRQALVVQNLSFDKLNLKASLNHGVRLSSVSEDVKNSSRISESQKVKIDKYLTQISPEDIRTEHGAPPAYDVKSNHADPQVLKSLDDPWSIILSLYPEINTNLYERPIIYNENFSPNVGELKDFKNSSLVESSKDASSITAFTNNDSSSVSEGSSNYSIFAANDLAVIPSENLTILAVNQAKGMPWLTLLPISERGDGTIGYGPLPNMAPRAEMFNRLAIGVNLLNEIRIIIPKLACVSQETNFTTQLSPTDSHGEKIINGGSGKSKKTVRTQKYCVKPTSDMHFKSDTEVTREFLTNAEITNLVGPDSDLRGGAYIQTSTQEESYRIDFVLHPFYNFQTDTLTTFANRYSHISKWMIRLEESVGTCGEELALTVDGSPVIAGRGLHGETAYIPIENSTVPITIITKTFKITKLEALGLRLDVPSSAKTLSRTNGSFAGEVEYAEQGCRPFKSHTISPITSDFYPTIVSP